MNINWGLGIALFYLTFMVVLLFFVFKSTTYDNSLVMDNYYEQDLRYQEHYDKIVNTQNLEKGVVVNYKAKQQKIEIHFPPVMKDLNGTLHFFHPSTKNKDVTLALQANENGQMTILTDRFASGRWKIKLDWVSNQKAYFKEIELIL